MTALEKFLEQLYCDYGAGGQVACVLADEKYYQFDGSDLEQVRKLLAIVRAQDGALGKIILLDDRRVENSEHLKGMAVAYRSCASVALFARAKANRISEGAE